MDSENQSLFEDVGLYDTADVKKSDTRVESTLSKDTPQSYDPVRNIENWFMEELKSAIPEDMHSIYINDSNVLFACESLKNEEFDLKRQTECIYEMTNRGKRSVLSCFDTLTFYTNLTYRNEMQRRRISLDYKTDPAFLRVIEPRTGKYILSNLVKCAVQQQKGLQNYLEYVKKNIFLFPLLEELNRFALSQKLAYRTARQKLWFLMSLAEELKLVDIGKTFKKLKEENPGEINRNVLDKRVTLRYFKTSSKTSTQDTVSKHTTPNEVTPVDYRKSVSVTTNDNNTSSDKPLSVDSLASVNLNYNQMTAGSNITMANGSNHLPFETNSSSLPDPCQSFSVDISSMNSLADFSNSVASNTPNPIGFTSLHIGEMSTPVRKDPNFETKQVDSFDSNFMKLIDQDSGNFMEFDNFMETSKSNFNYSESSQTGWQALQMIKKNKTKVEEPKMRHFVQKNLDKFVKKKQSFAFKNAVSTISVLEAACKLYGKGPKWSNPNKKEFDMANKVKKLVYIKPSKTVRESDLAYHYLMQYASVHQKLNGGVRQEHAVSYGIIDLKKPSANEPVKSYTVNTEPWNDDKYAKKWLKLASSINFTPWIISKFNVPRPSKSVVEESQSAEDISNKDKGVSNSSSTDKVSTTTQNTEGKDDDKKLKESLVANDENKMTGEEVDREVKSFSDGTISQVMDEMNAMEDKVVDMESQVVLDSVQSTQVLDVKVKSEPVDDNIESTNTTSTGVDGGDQLLVETHVETDELGSCVDLEKGETPKASMELPVMDEAKELLDKEGTNKEGAHNTGVSNSSSTDKVSTTTQTNENEFNKKSAVDVDGMTHVVNKLPGPDGKQMKLTELFKYVYDKISKSKQLPECPELMLVNKNKAMVKQELESFTLMGSEVNINTKRRKVLDDEFLEPMPENYVKISKPGMKTEVKQVLSDSEDEDYRGVKDDEYMDVDQKLDIENEKKDNREVSNSSSTGKASTTTQNIEDKLKVKQKNKDRDEVKEKEKDKKRSKLSKNERIMRMREIMKSMIEFEAEESEDENLSDPEEIKRSLELLKEKLMNPSESESEIESETEIAREMKDFIGEVEINEEDEEIARQRFYEDLRIQEEAELAKLMTFKEKGEKELTRREERLKLLMKLKNAKKTDEFHLSDFESSDEESGVSRKHRVKVTREDVDRLLRFKLEQKEMSKEEQLEQFIDYKLTEANIKLPSVDEVTVSTNFIEVPKSGTEHDPAAKVKTRRDMVDSMFNEGFDSIFSNIDQYKSDSSLTVNPFGTPNRSLDKMDNSSSKSPKKPALVMKSFRWDHSQAKPGNTTTVRNFRGFTGFHNFPSTFGQGKSNKK